MEPPYTAESRVESSLVQRGECAGACQVCLAEEGTLGSASSVTVAHT